MKYAKRLCLALALAVGGLWLVGAVAQTLPSNLTPDQLRDMLGGADRANQPTAIPPANTTQTTVIEPVGASQGPLPDSRLESIMTRRAGTMLHLFGYDQFGTGHPITLPQVGAVQDDYIVGPGDELAVTFRGQENSDFRTTVDRDGRFILPRLPPLSAGGHTLGQLRADLSSAVHRAYVATDAFVTVSRLRQISVLVGGEVNNPGTRTLTGLASAIDAVILSGGVKKTGSLRHILVQRGPRTFTIDLYAVLTRHGRSGDVRLTDGDRIIVSPLGRTTAVSGWVRNEGIFELPTGASSMSVSELIALAGGMEVSGAYKLSILHLLPDGRLQFVVANKGDRVRDGEILVVQPAASETVGMVTLGGPTGVGGHYPAGRSSRLSDLLKAPGALGDSPDVLFGLVVRYDPQTHMQSLLAFTPVAVLQGREDMNLQSKDVVRVFSAKEQNILSTAVENWRSYKRSVDQALHDPLGHYDSAPGINPALAAQAPGSPTTQASVSSTPPASNDALASLNLVPSAANATPATPNSATPGPNSGTPGLTATASWNDPRYAKAVAAAVAGNTVAASQGPPSGGSATLQNNVAGGATPPPDQEVSNLQDLANQLSVDPTVLLNFLSDHLAVVNGAVRGPGTYVVGPSVTLADLVNAAGGTVGWADQSGVELITTSVDSATGSARTNRTTLPLRTGTLASYIVQPSDEIHLNQVFTDIQVGTVAVQGEVRFPGDYSILRGDHLSQLLIRAGGLTTTAYPYGAVFLRKSAAAAERDGYQRAAREMQSQLIVAMTRGDPTRQLSPEAFTALQTFIGQLATQTPLGRVSLVVDPVVLAVKPELDPLLEPGDVIYIPQRPSSISVLGEVKQQGSFGYIAGASVHDYLDKAGGLGQFADDSLIFVVLPDGSARQVSTSWTNFSDNSIPPGSVIVVPRDLAPLELRQLLLDATQVLSQLAVTAASLSVISRTN